MGLVSYIISPSCPFSFYGVREQVAHEAKKIQNKHILNYWGPKKNSTLEHQYQEISILLYFTILKSYFIIITSHFTIPPHPKLLFLYSTH